MRITLALGFMFSFSSAVFGQQAGSPPFEKPIASLTEKGDHTLVVTYHQNKTCDITVEDGRQWHCAWYVQEDGKFCFTQDGGSDAGKTFCKQGRLIGRVALDGSPLNAPATSPRCPPNFSTGATKAEITSAFVGNTFMTDLGNIGQNHYIAYLSYGSDGHYSYRNPQNSSDGRYEIGDGVIYVYLATGYSRCDGIVKDGDSFILIDKVGHKFPLRLSGRS
jgi:hypothetical protein